MRPLAILASLVIVFFMVVPAVASASWEYDDEAGAKGHGQEWTYDDEGGAIAKGIIVTDTPILTIMWAFIIFLIPLVMQYLLGRIGMMVGFIITALAFGMMFQSFIVVSVIMIANVVILFYRGEHT